MGGPVGLFQGPARLLAFLPLFWGSKKYVFLALRKMTGPVGGGPVEIWLGSGGRPFVQTAEARAPFLKGSVGGSGGRLAAQKRRKT